MQLSTVRGWQFSELENNIQSIERIIRLSDPAALTTFRDSGAGWTALEALCHLRDFEVVFLQRAKVTVEQENPPLPFPSPDELAQERHYNQQNPDEVLAAWKTNRAIYLTYMRERADTDWERTAVHPKRGVLTLFEQLCLSASHDTVHMEQITRTLFEKKLP